MNMTQIIFTALLVLSRFIEVLGVHFEEPKTLVLVDSMSMKQTYSTFFGGLQARGHVLEYLEVTDQKLKLQMFGEYIYDNVIIFAPQVKEFGGSISVEAILLYIDEGHNVLIAVDEKPSEKLREFANECGVDFDIHGAKVIDHHNFNSIEHHGEHTQVFSDAWIDSPPIVGEPGAPVLFKGIAQTLDLHSEYVFPILSGSGSTISASTKQTVSASLQSAGSKTLLVTALQGRNNARVTFSGSLEMFSDKFFSLPVEPANGGPRYDQSGNEEFCTSLGKWTFKERGLLKAENVLHHLRDNATNTNPRMYTIEDWIKYSVDISEWSWEYKNWIPFTRDDVQLELVRLDPFQLRDMDTDGKGHYWTEFQLPDQFGIYHFTIDYHRRGYSNLVLMNQIAVRPYRHNEFERFLDVALPYYASEFSMLIGFFLFGLVFLYHRDDDSSKKNSHSDESQHRS